MDILYIVMPAYNEEETIAQVIASWYPLLHDKSEDSRLVVADSGSTDKTHLILTKLQHQYPKLELLSETDKQHGPKVMALYRFSIKQGADYIFQTDSDGQTNPAEFHQFWELRKQYDAIIGKRLCRGDGMVRASVEHILCGILWIYFHVRVPDANAPFRLMNKDILKKYLSRLPSDYNLPNVMLTTYFVFHREKIKFVDITFRQRLGGINSINFLKIMRIGWDALHDFHTFQGELNIK